MSRMPFLTDAEIKEIVFPLTQPAAIVRWFRKNGFTEMKVRPNGMPLISLEHFDSIASGGMVKPAAAPPREEPDVEGYLTRIQNRERRLKKRG
jgi:hypothetical protein